MNAIREFLRILFARFSFSENVSKLKCIGEQPHCESKQGSLFRTPSNASRPMRSDFTRRVAFPGKLCFKLWWSPVKKFAALFRYWKDNGTGDEEWTLLKGGLPSSGIKAKVNEWKSSQGLQGQAPSERGSAQERKEEKKCARAFLCWALKR